LPAVRPYASAPREGQQEKALGAPAEATPKLIADCAVVEKNGFGIVRLLG
jgi:hypothetical protein